jgi:hypothetical protein
MRAQVVKGPPELWQRQCPRAFIPQPAQQMPKLKQTGLVRYITKGVALGMVSDLLGYAALTLRATVVSRSLPNGCARIDCIGPSSPASYSGLGFVAFGPFATVQSRYRRI